MSDFTALIAKAITPAMPREEREAVYTMVRDAVARLQERDGFSSDDPRAALRRHLVEETIRDIEGDLSRFEALRKLEAAFAAQSVEHKAQGSRRR
ncbi:hypothetical protein [Methylobacterium aerolatum]|uniref:Addiction module antitoxin RelB n=1 Tax=Methylobacterium aerolatum TaxID=418708 RepID=A0ABU0HWA3_9HYPH|nr:hypothetical protein [Methylobacterium aerolatum]MDQ0446172.1 hypothetical protein [Methylobacterium aerolatum]GJD35514.1 hypothetical protein FMGBMHLM_2424 [Methylobacterium aerolatum]